MNSQVIIKAGFRIMLNAIYMIFNPWQEFPMLDFNMEAGEIANLC